MREARLKKTLVDYMVIAISPALIMTLVGSFVFFLLTALYEGDHHFRLTWVFGFFILGAVMIGRLSIDEGREHATMFAVPLALAVGVAVFSLTDLSSIVSLLLIGVIWYCSHKLTWDCTVIDEYQDASGEGLMQRIGLDGATDASADDDEPDTTTSTEPSTPQNLWQKYVASRRKAHTPGLWVVYFSIVALPAFGFGQLLIPSGYVANRNYAFRMLLIYVASALGLLMTTSFLGLRRYLRQRRMEMPVEMAGGWLTLGGTLIVGLLVFCLLLPRPSSEGTFGDLAAKFGSPDDLWTSDYGWGEGEEDENRSGQVDPNAEGEPQGTTQQDADEQSSTGSRKDSKRQPQQSQSQSDGDSSSQSGDQQSQSDSESGEDSPSSKSQSKQQETSNQESQDSSDRAQDKSQTEQQSDSSSDSSEQQGDETTQSNDGRSADERQQQQDRQSERERSQQERDEQSQQSQAKPPPPSQPPMDLLSSLPDIVMVLLKFAFWALLATIAIYYVIRNWEAIVAAWKKFLQELSEFWARLFGGQRSRTSTTNEERPAASSFRPFASFRNPFTSGAVNHESPDAVVKYTFEALEAWARESGFPRPEDQTPQEFAQQIAQHAPHIGGESIQLADLYNQAAYAGNSLPATTLQQLQTLWQKLTSTPAPPVPTA